MMNLSQASHWLESLSNQVRHVQLPKFNVYLDFHQHGGLGSQWFAGTVGMAALVCATCLLIAIVQHRSKSKIENQLHRIRSLAAEVKMTDRLEENLNKMLFMVEKVIQAPYYAFYVWDVRSDRFILRTVSHPYDLFKGVGPAYSGLALPKREVYLPPRIMEESDDARSVFLQRDGDVQLLCLRIGEKQGLIRIGPVERPKQGPFKELAELSELFVPFLTDYLDFDKYQTEHAVRALANACINKLAGSATNVSCVVELILRMFVGASGAVGGAFVETRNRERSRVYSEDVTAVWVNQLEQDGQMVSSLDRMVRRNGQHLLTREDAEFYELPNSITSLEDVEAVVLRRIPGFGLLVVLFSHAFSREQYLSVGGRQIRFMADELAHALEQSAVQEGIAGTHTGVLTKLADFLDNVNPYTVGYSEMMMRYSLVVGKELGLPDNELHDLALGARLSNIGLIGMDMRRLYKAGKYTDLEFNLMKYHCEIGAAIIETVTGNRQAAAYVLHHHERVDGHGYPHGISGEGIPVGAKILHTVQVFLAKVNGRAWRATLDYERALQELERSSGASLDPDVVAALIGWLSKTSNNPERKGSSLGACHEMCCVPKVICQSCPAFHQPQHCWEIPNNHCKAHGKECEHCFVRTEYLHRTPRMA